MDPVAHINKAREVGILETNARHYVELDLNVRAAERTHQEAEKT